MEIERGMKKKNRDRSRLTESGRSISDRLLSQQERPKNDEENEIHESRLPRYFPREKGNGGAGVKAICAPFPCA